MKSVRIRRFSSLNAGKYGPEKLRILTLFYAVKLFYNVTFLLLPDKVVVS